MQITVRDETATGQITNEMVLEFLTEEITVRELIRERVYQEVQDHNLKLRTEKPAANGPVPQAHLEQQLNPPRKSHRKEIDWQAEFEKAIDGFLNNRFFILIDARQPDTLDERIQLRPDTQVSFIRLVPLVGG